MKCSVQLRLCSITDFISGGREEGGGGGKGCFSLTSLVLEGLCRGQEMEGACTGSPAKPAETE